MSVGLKSPVPVCVPSSRQGAQVVWSLNVVGALSGRERHTHARPDNLGYPSRAIYAHQFLYIRNFAPERWPAGDEFHDIDACPSLTFLRERADTPQGSFFLEASVGKRPAEECFDILKDPARMRNLAGEPGYATLVDQLGDLLMLELTKQEDPQKVQQVRERFLNPTRGIPACGLILGDLPSAEPTIRLSNIHEWVI